MAKHNQLILGTCQKFDSRLDNFNNFQIVPIESRANIKKAAPVVECGKSQTIFIREATNIFAGAPGLFNIINLALLQNIKLLLLLLEKKREEMWWRECNFFFTILIKKGKMCSLVFV